MRTRRQLKSSSSLAARAGLCLLVGAGLLPATSLAQDSGGPATASPIQHLVIIFQENVSFDHYFATYPVALNPTGEPFFRARDDTPSVNGLGTLTNGNPDGVC
jgi:phospholipase C